MGVVLQSYEVSFQPYLTMTTCVYFTLKGAQMLIVESSPNLSECLDHCSVDRVVTLAVIITIAATDYVRKSEILRKLITGSTKKEFYDPLSTSRSYYATYRLRPWISALGRKGFVYKIVGIPVHQF